MEKNVIFNGDCLDFINRLDYKFNLVVTSPPYNTCRNLTSERARKNHEGRYDIYQEEKTNNEYDDWVVNIFNAIDGKLEENGCVIWNVSYGTENPTQMWTSITAVCEKTNFIIADTIIWKKKTALPNNVSPNKLTRICEFIFIFCRKKEYDTFFCNKELSEKQSPKQKIYKNYYNYIEAPNNDGVCDVNKATYSSELVGKLLLLYSKETDVVFDPFMGSGTTAIGAIRTNRQFVGTEISKEQCVYANNRIKLATNQLSLV